MLRLTRRVGLALAVLSLVAGSEGLAEAGTIDFYSLGDFQTPLLDVGGVTITGSNTLNVNIFPPDLNTPFGLGVVGLGLPFPSGVLSPYDNQTIDPGESITFQFDSPPAVNIVLTTGGEGTYGNPNSPPTPEFLITAFDPSGHSLGTADSIGPGPYTFDFPITISSAFANQPISSFRVSPKGDLNSGSFITIMSLSFASVPEPSSLTMGATAVLIGLGYWCRRFRP